MLSCVQGGKAHSELLSSRLLPMLGFLSEVGGAEAAMGGEECVVLGRQEVGSIPPSTVGAWWERKAILIKGWDSAVISPVEVG